MEKVKKHWGTYEVISQDDRSKVKILEVNPGCKLSLQYHHHRSEHWVVTKGIALVRIEDSEFLVGENKHVYVPLGSKHRISNPGIIPLVIIEVQIGGYLEESDIVRLEV